MHLLHGSENIITHPVLGAGNPRNDFGPGFYCTHDASLAGEWACKRCKDGFVNSYRLDDEGLSTLDLMDGSHSVLEWIALLLANRRFSPRSQLGREAKAFLLSHCLPSITGHDIVIGYRADDSYFSYAEDFVEGALSVSELSAALHLGGLGLQTVLVSARGFERLEFLGAEPASASRYHASFLSRDQRARQKYFDGTFRLDAAIPRPEDDIYVLDLFRKEVSLDDERIPRMLSF